MNDRLRISSVPAALGFVSCLILVLNLSSRVAALTIDDTQSRSTEQSEALVAGWIAQGEHKDFPWKLTVSEPQLNYDQASYVRVTATIPLDERRKMGMARDLHFIVKVADETGQWLDGRVYNQRKLESGIASSEVEFWASIGFRPGQFRIATIIYDAVAGRRNVAFTPVKVHLPGSEPFPEVLSRLSRVNFDTNGASSFPVATERPIQLDLVIEFGTRVVRKHQLHRMVHAPRLFSPAIVLSRLKLENGCIRLTGLDSLHQRTVIPSQPASAVDVETVWTKIFEEDANARVTVSVDQLGTRPSLEAARYFHKELERIIAEPPACSFNATPTSTPVHVVAILTSGVDFIKGTPRPRVESECNCRIFYLYDRAEWRRLFHYPYHDVLEEVFGGGVDQSIHTEANRSPLRRLPANDPVHQPKPQYDPVNDRLKSIIDPLSPKVLEFDGPVKFRQKFFEFIAALKNLSTED